MLPRLAAVTVAAVGIYLPTLGLPLPGSCLQTGAVASAGPSPSCSGDLRECLRQSADLRQTTFGGRYVTAEDVARCVEAFTACTHGGAGTGGNTASPPASASGGGRKGLPERFAITTEGLASDCRRSGDTISCDERLTAPYGSTDTSTATVAGTLSGLTMTGSIKGHQTGHAPADPSCRYEQDFSGTATYVFNLDGSVTMQYGAPQIEGTYSCEGTTPTSFTGQAWAVTGTWSAIP